MFTRLSSVVLPALLLAGCAARVGPPTLTAEHPASPSAPEAPLSRPSTTLSVTEADNGGEPSGAKATGSIQHHPGVSMPGMNMPGMAGMPHRTDGPAHGGDE